MWTVVEQGFSARCESVPTCQFSTWELRSYHRFPTTTTALEPLLLLPPPPPFFLSHFSALDTHQTPHVTTEITSPSLIHLVLPTTSILAPTTNHVPDLRTRYPTSQQLRKYTNSPRVACAASSNETSLYSLLLKTPTPAPPGRLTPSPHIRVLVGILKPSNLHRNMSAEDLSLIHI